MPRRPQPDMPHIEHGPRPLLVPDLGRDEDSFGSLGHTSETTPYAFRIIRPTDLVVLDVLGWNLRLVSTVDGPALIPEGDGARMEVRLPFQHLADRAYFESSEIPDRPPINALAAYSSRLVYAVPRGESIAYSTEGVLAAMSRLRLLVAPLATPTSAVKRPYFSRPNDIVILLLPGGVQLTRTPAGLVLRDTPGRRDEPAGGALDRVLSGAVALRAARKLLAEETATNRSQREFRVGGLILGPTYATPATDRRTTLLARRLLAWLRRHLCGRFARLPRPRPPAPEETAIEAPYRLIISPSGAGGFAHAMTPQAAPDDAGLVELWHSRLGVRRVVDQAVTIDERSDWQRAVRAIWARDKDGAEPVAHDNEPFRMSLDGLDRVILVRQSSDPLLAPPNPVGVRRLHLSSLGAYLDLHGRWTVTPYTKAGQPSIISWDHEAPMGRDQFVRVATPGYLFPVGHRCALITETQRKIKESATPQTHLYQRKYLVVSEADRSYDDRSLPFRQIGVRPLVTPNLKDPVLATTPHVIDGPNLFWPVAEGPAKFQFTLDCVDHDGRRVWLQAALLFVDASVGGSTADRDLIQAAYTNDPDRNIVAAGQSIAYAPSGHPGDTSLETVELRLTGLPGAPPFPSSPLLEEADVVIPAMRHLAPAAPRTTVHYARSYIESAFAGKNADPQVFLELAAPARISFRSGTDKAGGFIQPDLPVRGLSRVLGAVGDIDDLINKPPPERFNPTSYLRGALPQLFGLFDLVDILEVLGIDGAPTFLTEQLDRVAGLLADLAALHAAVQRSADRLAEDAAAAATPALRDQADASRARLAVVLGPLQTRVDELVDKVEDLLALDVPSSPGDVNTAVSAALAALEGHVDDVGAVIREQPLPPPVKAELERLVTALGPVLDAAEIAQTIETITSFVNGIDPEGMSVRARFDWRPALTNFPNVPDNDALFVVRRDGLLLSVEARASGPDGVGTDVLAELREFSLNLFPTAPLMQLGFDRIAFRASSGRKPEVDVVFRGIEFVGVLSFIETLKQLIPFDGFADPPYLDVGPRGVTAGFDVALPSVAVGVFSLENVALGADARVPFLGEAVTVGFYFCTREKPFRLTVMMIGGGGFVGIRLSPKGLVLLEMSLEAGAALSVTLGAASGSVSVMIGLYLRLEGDAGSLTGYYRIRGEVDVLGLISASITLELSLTYEFATGKMVGRASITIQVEILFLSFPVVLSCERRLAGSNADPTFAEILDMRPDGTSVAWDVYRASFAEV